MTQEIFEGSSPRVRGSQGISQDIFLKKGIIPAGAGLTVMIITFQTHVRDHPRGCGAHGGMMATRKQKPGSSPRVRGSPKKANVDYKALRIIPAGAGLTKKSQYLRHSLFL